MIDTKLVTFLVLLEEKSYTKTASRLFITQPAVTHHIKTLEKEYEITLFTNTKTFELTKAGAMLLEYAKNQKTQEALLMSSLKKQDNCIYNIGFTPMVRGLLPAYLEQFIQYEGAPLFNSVCKNYDELMSLLQTGKLDFVFVDRSFDSSNYEAILVNTEKVVLVGKADGQFKGKDKITREQLASAVLVNPDENSGLFMCVDSSLKAKNIRLKNATILDTNDPEIMKIMIRVNDGLGFMYQDVVKDDIEEGRLKKIEIANLAISQNIYLLYNKSFPVDDSLKKFVDQISKIGK